MSDRFLTVAQAQARVKRSKRTIENWITEGLPVVMLEGMRYVEQEALLAHFRMKLQSNPNRRRRAERDG